MTSVASIIGVLMLIGCVGCRMSHDKQLRRLIWDKDTRRLMVVNGHEFSTVSGIRVDTLHGTLDLKLKYAGLILNRRWAVGCSVELPPEIMAVKINGTVIPLSELRAAEPIRKLVRLEDEIIFRPDLYPSTYKFKYYHVKDKW